MDEKISIFVNNEKKQCQLDLSLQAFVDLSNISQKGIAIAINETIIQKANWSSTLLKENDALLIIQATQGG